MGRGFKTQEHGYFVRPLLVKCNGENQYTGEFQDEAELRLDSHRKMGTNGQYNPTRSLYDVIVEYKVEQEFAKSGKDRDVTEQKIRKELDPRYFQNLEHSIINHVFNYSIEDLQRLVQFEVDQHRNAIEKEAHSLFNAASNIKTKRLFRYEYYKSKDEIFDELYAYYQEEEMKNLF